MPEPIPIVCPYCGVGCNLELTLDEKAAILGLLEKAKKR